MTDSAAPGLTEEECYEIVRRVYDERGWTHSSSPGVAERNTALIRAGYAAASPPAPQAAQGDGLDAWTAYCKSRGFGGFVYARPHDEYLAFSAGFAAGQAQPWGASPAIDVFLATNGHTTP